MNRTEFWILNGTSLLLAGLIIFEMNSSDQLEDAQNLARSAQIPILQSEQLQPLARRMVQAVATRVWAGPRSSGELLAKYGFEVTPPSPPRATSGRRPRKLERQRHAHECRRKKVLAVLGRF